MYSSSNYIVFNFQYGFKKRICYDKNVDGPPRCHWLDYSIEKYGEKLVSDMKIVFSILYLYLPVPIFWSLFDQQVLNIHC